MKTIAILIATFTAAVALFAAPAAQAADNAKGVNSYATLPYLGWDAPKR